jgi:hypothetical protein
MKDLLYNTRKKYDIGVAFTATQSTVDVFKEFLPSSLIHTKGYDYGKADQYLSKCKELTSRGKQRNTLMILDDCVFDQGVMKSDTIPEIHLNGRHSYITLFNTCQYAMIIPPVIRSNVDYVCVMMDSVLANRKRLYEFFFGNFPNFQQFDIVFTQVTANHGCLILDKTQPSGSVNDSVFYYKAKTDLPQFRIGKRMFFEMGDCVERLKEESRENCGNQQIVTVPKK